MLHAILGLGNDVNSKFKEFIQERSEKVSEEELAATNMTLLAEINHDEGLLKHDDLKNEVAVLTAERIEINAKLKGKGKSREWKTALKSKNECS